MDRILGRSIEGDESSNGRVRIPEIVVHMVAPVARGCTAASMLRGSAGITSSGAQAQPNALMVIAKRETAVQVVRSDLRSAHTY